MTYVKKRYFFKTNLNIYSIDAFEISEKILPSGVFMKSSFFTIMKKGNLLNKSSEKASLFHSVLFPYINVEQCNVM